MRMLPERLRTSGGVVGALRTGIVALIVTAPIMALSLGHAAQLQVIAAPLQTWVVTDLPNHPSYPDLSSCGDLSKYDDVIVGTADDDQLQAAPPSESKGQVLVGLGGNDVLRGGNHDDCLIGGKGVDRLFGGNGQDILLGGADADYLDGGTGKDTYQSGEDPGDHCEAWGAPDLFLDVCNAS